MPVDVFVSVPLPLPAFRPRPRTQYTCGPGWRVQEEDRGRQRISVRLCEADSGRIAIEVADTGVGIPAENMSRLFQHGFTTKKDGHGFGLHSSALAAKDLGGTLTCVSGGECQGATFRLEIPFAAAAEAAA